MDSTPAARTAAVEVTHHADPGMFTPAEAVDRFRPLVDVWADRQADAAIEGADW